MVLKLVYGVLSVQQELLDQLALKHLSYCIFTVFHFYHVIFIFPDMLTTLLIIFSTCKALQFMSTQSA